MPIKPHILKALTEYGREHPGTKIDETLTALIEIAGEILDEAVIRAKAGEFSNELVKQLRELDGKVRN